MRFYMVLKFSSNTILRSLSSRKISVAKTKNSDLSNTDFLLNQKSCNSRIPCILYVLWWWGNYLSKVVITLQKLLCKVFLFEYLQAFILCIIWQVLTSNNIIQKTNFLILYSDHIFITVGSICCLEKPYLIISSVHSSKVIGLCLMKWSGDMHQNIP